MNNNIKYAAAFVAGAASGATVAYFLTRKKAQEHFSQMAAEDIASVKAHYRKKEAALEENEKNQKLSTKLEDLGYLADTTMVDTKKLRTETRDWNGSHAVETDEDDANEAPAESVVAYQNTDGDIVEVHRAGRDTNEPYLITQNEYDDNDDFDKIEIVYYEGDDTLADEDESEIVDPSNILGDFDPSKFGSMDPSEPDQMLIRNSKLRADYTVIRDSRTYTKVILGFEEPEDKPPIRKMRPHE